MNGFHANGQADLLATVQADPQLRKQRQVEKRLRIESLLAERVGEFQSAGYWEKQKILRQIHVQVDRELSFDYCLF